MDSNIQIAAITGLMLPFRDLMRHQPTAKYAPWRPFTGRNAAGDALVLDILFGTLVFSPSTGQWFLQQEAMLRLGTSRLQADSSPQTFGRMPDRYFEQVFDAIKQECQSFN